MKYVVTDNGNEWLREIHADHEFNPERPDTTITVLTMIDKEQFETEPKKASFLGLKEKIMKTMKAQKYDDKFIEQCVEETQQLWVDGLIGVEETEKETVGTRFLMKEIDNRDSGETWIVCGDDESEIVVELTKDDVMSILGSFYENQVMEEEGIESGIDDEKFKENADELKKDLQELVNWVNGLIFVCGFRLDGLNVMRNYDPDLVR